LSATKEEVANKVVREVLDRVLSGYIKWRPNYVENQLIANNWLLDEANKGLEEKISLLPYSLNKFIICYTLMLIVVKINE